MFLDNKNKKNRARRLSIYVPQLALCLHAFIYYIHVIAGFRLVFVFVSFTDKLFESSNDVVPTCLPGLL